MKNEKSKIRNLEKGRLRKKEKGSFHALYADRHQEQRTVAEQYSGIYFF